MASTSSSQLARELLELLLDLAVAAVDLDLVPVARAGSRRACSLVDLLALAQQDLALVVDEARRRGLADEQLAHLARSTTPR